METINISETLFHANDDEVTLKICNDSTKIVWTDVIPIRINDDKFSHPIILSRSKWTSSGTCILVEIDDNMASIIFGLSLEKRIYVEIQ